MWRTAQPCPSPGGPASRCPRACRTYTAAAPRTRSKVVCLIRCWSPGAPVRPPSGFGSWMETVASRLLTRIVPVCPLGGVQHLPAPVGEGAVQQLGKPGGHGLQRHGWATCRSMRPAVGRSAPGAAGWASRPRRRTCCRWTTATRCAGPSGIAGWTWQTANPPSIR